MVCHICEKKININEYNKYINNKYEDEDSNSIKVCERCDIKLGKIGKICSDT